MKNGEWFLKLKIRVVGENSVGDSFNIDAEVQFPLYATDSLQAEKNAETVIATITKAIDAEDKDFFRAHCSAIDDEDGVSVSDFCICFEKKLETPELSIVAGP